MARSEHAPTGLIYYNRGLSLRGYTLFSADREYAYLIDMDGKIVHRWEYHRGIHIAELLPSGNLLALSRGTPDVEGQRGLNGSASSCFEMDWSGNIVWEYEDLWLHHDHHRLENGNTLLVKWEELPGELVPEIKGGYNHEDDEGNGMLGDLIIEIDPSGSIAKQWKSWEHFDPDIDVICPLEHRREWSHCNSISTAPGGRWLLSFRNTSRVMMVDESSGDILWRLDEHVTNHQHDAKFTENGTVTIFDNGVHRRGIEYSRVLEIDAEERNEVWEYRQDPPFSFYTFMQGSADRLPNGNTLICEASKGEIFEVTPDKKVVWDYINPFFVANRRMGGRINLVARAHRYGPEYPAFADKDLDPDRFANLNRLYG